MPSRLSLIRSLLGLSAALAFGPLTVDVAYGGNYYAIIEPQGPYQGLDALGASRIVELSRTGPLIVINASDLEAGTRFAFLQDHFDLLCSDLRSYPLANAVAASSAVPLLFEPMVLENRAGCAPPGEWRFW